jgi:hypothetical protein
LHFAIFFIGKIHFRFVLSRGACEAVKTAPLLVVDEAVEAMNKAAGFKYGVATYFMQSINRPDKRIPWSMIHQTLIIGE